MNNHQRNPHSLQRMMRKKRKEKHTIHNSLIKRQRSRTKPHQNRPRRPPPLQNPPPPLLISTPQNPPQINRISHHLSQIKPRLRLCPRIILLQSLPAIDVIDFRIQRIGRPERRVVFSSDHAVRSQEDVARVPEDERCAECEPEEREGAGGVGPGFG